jgi:hypothetical protein
MEHAQKKKTMRPYSPGNLPLFNGVHPQNSLSHIQFHDGCDYPLLPPHDWLANDYLPL